MADIGNIAGGGGRVLLRSKKDKKRTLTKVHALEIEGNNLRVVEVAVQGGLPKVNWLKVIPLQNLDEVQRASGEAVGKVVGAALEKAKMKLGPVVMGVARSQVLLKTLLLPNIKDLGALASIVHLQMAKDLPFRPSDAVIDFRVNREVIHNSGSKVVSGSSSSPKAENDSNTADPESEETAGPISVAKLELTVGIAKAEVVSYYTSIAASAGLKLEGLGLLPFGGVRCLAACQLENPEDLIGLISLRDGEVGIDVVQGASLVFSRGCRIASDTVDRADAQSAPSIEVIRTLRSFMGQGTGPLLRRVFVIGTTGAEAGLSRTITNEMGLEVRVLSVGERLRFPPDVTPESNSCVAIMGLGFSILDGPGMPLDFLNPKKPAVERDMRRLQILVSLVLIGSFLFGVAGLRTWLVRKKQVILTALNQEAESAEKHRGVYRKMIQQASVVGEWVKGERDWLDHYAYLSAVLPPSEEMHITSFAVTGQRALRLAVQARSGEILAKVEKQLRAAGYDVRPLSITPGTDRHGYDFRSNVELIVPEKMKVDLTKVKAPERPTDDVSLEPPLRKGGG